MIEHRCRMHQEHLAIVDRFDAVKHVMLSERPPLEKQRVCSEALELLREHIRNENASMDEIGYPEEQAKPHKAVHAMMLAYLDLELEAFRSGRSDGMQAIDLAEEWLNNHLIQFDQPLSAFVITRTYGARGPSGPADPAPAGALAANPG